jgi:hypothetical protein
MTSFQTALYKVVLVDFQFGWDYSDVLFESHIYPDPRNAMLELNFFEPTHNNWFATMRMIEDDEIVEEDLFDSSVIEIDY